MLFTKDFVSAVAMIFPAEDTATEWFRQEVSIAKLKSAIGFVVGPLENLGFVVNSHSASQSWLGRQPEKVSVDLRAVQPFFAKICRR